MIDELDDLRAWLGVIDELGGLRAWLGVMASGLRTWLSVTHVGMSYAVLLGHLLQQPQSIAWRDA